MKCAIYIRVSKYDQVVENQRLILEEYAKRQQWEWVIWEEVESTRKTRPVKQALMNELRHRKYDAIMVLNLTRFARSLQELITDVNELVEKGITFISYRDNLDLSTATGRLQYHILGSFAEFERDIIRERTMDGLARARAQGKKLGRPFKTKQSPPVSDELPIANLIEKFPTQ